MKKLLLPVLTVLCFAVFQKAQAQVDVTVNPIGLLFGDLSVGADFALSESFSIEPTIGLGTGKWDEANFKWVNIPVTVFGKYYFNPNHGADRFYADAFLRFVSRKYTADGGTSSFSEYTQTRFGLGVGIGYKVVSGKGFVFDIGFGVGRALLDKYKYEDTSGTDTAQDIIDIMFAGKLGIGYRFGGGKN